MTAVPDPSLEWLWLQRAEAAGAEVTPMALVASAVEGDFYRLNNLRERIEGHLAPLNALDPDPDDLEALLPQVRAWVLEHTLLEVVIDDFYAAIADLPSRVVVRRPGEGGTSALRGRPTLLAVKRTWAEAWRLEPTLARVRAGAGFAPAPLVTLVHDAQITLDPELGRSIGAALGTPLEAFRDRQGRLARLHPRRR